MSADSEKPITRLLHATATGDRDAAKDLLPLVYAQLRSLAGARLAELPPGQTLQPTALVHEAYLRVAGKEDPGWDGRRHFFAAAARAMRDILVDEARRKTAIKRGGGRQREDLDEAKVSWGPAPEDVLAVHEALERLEAEDPLKGQIVNLRYFAQLSAQETAAALGLSITTLRREWLYVRAWLEREVRERARE